MTLFKKVFRSHAAVEADDPTLPELQEDAGMTETPDEEFMTDLSSISGVDTFELPKTDESTDQAFDADTPAEHEAPVESRMQTSQPIAPAEESTPEPTMAERAAAAQRQIELSQQRFAAEQGSFQTAPSPAERKVEDVPAPVAATPDKMPPAPVEQGTAAPATAAPQRPGRSAKRARTRLLGFNQNADAAPDPFANSAKEKRQPSRTFPVGWLVVVKGPGRGHSLTLYDGVSTIGRGEDQAVKLDFGDTSISRQHHAAVAYDDEQKKFFLGHGGKSNIIRLNDKPVLSTEELSHADMVRIGETTLRFVALCDDDFNWGAGDHDGE